ncbi:hypothetical protein M8C21_015705 [Ambrosia artemisiifolia]|uniref:Uncharacterized protein n=1 Tax=Ambrosia artemisiifolia TaxID=4212 RepID=A0AAD5G6J7_AMBAR|nr:hypothetical protein M8C21_015705 [Ambrosia artemisiifolia]
MKKTLPLLQNLPLLFKGLTSYMAPPTLLMMFYRVWKIKVFVNCTQKAQMLISRRN